MKPYFIGLMSGYSLDGVEAALVRFAGGKANIVHAITHEFPIELQEGLLNASRNARTLGLHAYGELDVAVGGYFAQATQALLKEAKVNADQVEALGSFGHTVLHQPHRQHAFTLQIGDPNIIAAFANVPVVADFRRRDVAEFGEGQPLISGFLEQQLHDDHEHRVVVKLGGITNITIIHKALEKPTWGFDSGPGTLLLDAWSMSQRLQPIDEGGSWALTGSIDGPLLKRLLTDPYLHRPAPKSTGRSQFNMSWLRKQIDADGRAIPPVDVQATLLEFTARTISDNVNALDPKPHRVLAYGGGWHNDFLVQRINELLNEHTLESTESHGLSVEWVDAVGCAWLAKRRLAGLPGNLPSVTGAERAVPLGGLYLP